MAKHTIRLICRDVDGDHVVAVLIKPKDMSAPAFESLALMVKLILGADKLAGDNDIILPD